VSVAAYGKIVGGGLAHTDDELDPGEAFADSPAGLDA
jgi:hypothetical protein